MNSISKWLRFWLVQLKMDLIESIESDTSLTSVQQVAADFKFKFIFDNKSTTDMYNLLRLRVE